jgi:hypothetical protein
MSRLTNTPVTLNELNRCSVCGKLTRLESGHQIVTFLDACSRTVSIHLRCLETYKPACCAAHSQHTGLYQVHHGDVANSKLVRVFDHSNKKTVTKEPTSK